MKEKMETVIILPNNMVTSRIDGYLYNPVNCIIIDDVEYHKWTQYDEISSEGFILRKIWLKE